MKTIAKSVSRQSFRPAVPLGRHIASDDVHGKVTNWVWNAPIGFKAGDANVTRYVSNQPTMATDPSGLAPPTTSYYQFPSQPESVNILVIDTSDHQAQFKLEAIKIAANPPRGWRVVQIRQEDDWKNILERIRAVAGSNEIRAMEFADHADATLQQQLGRKGQVFTAEAAKELAPLLEKVRLAKGKDYSNFTIELNGCTLGSQAHDQYRIDLANALQRPVMAKITLCLSDGSPSPPTIRPFKPEDYYTYTYPDSWVEAGMVPSQHLRAKVFEGPVFQEGLKKQLDVIRRRVIEQR